MALQSAFSKLAAATSNACGKPLTFIMAFFLIVVWGITGPIFHFNNTWQLVINTGTTIVTFLMVFLIQNTQNTDGEALQVKIDELIRVTRAHNALLDLEELDQKDLDRIRKCYRELARRARDELDYLEQELMEDKKKPGQGTPPVHGVNEI